MATVEGRISHAPMTSEERRVIFASSLGTVFEWYDFYLAGSLAIYISRTFFSGVNATAATARVATPDSTERFRASHELGRRCMPCSASRPTASRKAKNNVTSGTNWSGRISFSTGNLESVRHGSQGCPSQAGPLIR